MSDTVSNSAEAHYQRGVSLMMQGKWEEATACYRQSIALHPDSAQVQFSLGDALFHQGQFEEAEICQRRAVELNPGFAEAHSNLGAALMEANRVDEAEACYRRAIALKPDFVRAHYNLGIALLTKGQFAEGWPEFEWFWRYLDGQPIPRPIWNGEPLAGKTIFLYSDQGHGDALQSVRYVELLKQQGGRVVVQCPPSLVRLLGTCAGVDRVIADGQPAGAFDFHSALWRLPAVFKSTPDTIPARVPYVLPDRQLVEQWKGELGRVSGFKIGIDWQGGQVYWRDRNRSFPVSQFAAIARLPGVRLYSLQSGYGREQLAELGQAMSIVDLGDRLGDFHDTAAIVSNLDLVITCCSAPAHLAGALGVPVWVAVAFAPHWPWMLDREDTPWYPTMRLFRQTRPGDWPTVFEKIEKELSKLVRPHSGV